MQVTSKGGTAGIVWTRPWRKVMAKEAEERENIRNADQGKMSAKQRMKGGCTRG